MKKFRFKKYIIYLFLFLLYASITSLILILLSGETARNRIIFQHEAERKAAFLMESIINDLLSGEEVNIDEEVLGFGLYQADGVKIKKWGNAPERINPKNIERRKPVFNFNREKNTLTFIRKMGLHFPMHRKEMMERMRNLRRMSGGPIQPNILYLEVDAESYIHKHHFLRLVSLSLPIVILFIIIIIGFLYKKNQEYKKQLESKEHLANLGEIARTLSHEIKNPLGAMLIQTGYLKKILPEKNKMDVLLIEEEIDRLKLLTNKISDFVRDPVGVPEKIMIYSFLQELIKLYDKKVVLTRVQPDNQAILFDRERLRSVIENIINNAIDSQVVFKDEDWIPINIRLDKEKHNIVILVLDRGEGIKHKFMDKVFDPFYTTKTKGSGIGLAIAKRFIEAAGGSIKLLSRENGGTEVKISLRRI